MRSILISSLIAGSALVTPLLAMDADPTDPFAAFEQIKEMGDKLRWGGYGELHYNNYQNGGGASSKTDQLDLHRLIFLAEYKFDEQISFFTEVEIEHALVNDGQGELEVEQAYIDFAVNGGVHIRAGVMLVPISILNLYHEPPLFFGVERPITQKQIIPTTWFEPGIGVTGNINENLSYEVAIQAGLDNSGFGTDGIRGGRQKAYESKAEDLMVTARLDYRPMPEVWLAAAVNTGNTAQDPTGSADGANLTLLVLEGRYDNGPYKAGLTYAQGSLSDADSIAPGVSESFSGLEVFGGIDVMPFIDDSRDDSLSFFVRFELFDTQEDVPNGVPEDESNEGETVITYGFDYKPHENVVIKLDYQDFDNEAEDARDQWNLGIGWMF